MAKAEAGRLHQLREFYNVLAMHQVFTMPNTTMRHPTTFGRSALKVTGTFPVLAHFAVTSYDWFTSDIGAQIQDIHTLVTVAIETGALTYLLVMTWTSLKRLTLIDRIWDHWWDTLQGKQMASVPQRRRFQGVGWLQGDH